MAHPSDALPKDVYILSGSNTLSFDNGKAVYAINNPTASAITAACIGSIYTYQTNAYKPVATAQNIAVQPGATVYGRFTSVTGAGLLCYAS